MPTLKKQLNGSEKMADSKLAILWELVSINLGTLASATAVTTVSKIDTAREQGYRVTKTQWFIERLGATFGDDPILVGYAFGMTSGQITEMLAADPQGAVNSTDKEAQDRANRPAFPMAAFSAENLQIIMRDGETIPMWSAPEGGFLNWFALNFGGGALTTGGSVRILAKHFGVWLRD